MVDRASRFRPGKDLSDPTAATRAHYGASPAAGWPWPPRSRRSSGTSPHSSRWRPHRPCSPSSASGPTWPVRSWSARATTRIDCAPKLRSRPSAARLPSMLLRPPAPPPPQSWRQTRGQLLALAHRHGPPPLEPRRDAGLRRSPRGRRQDPPRSHPLPRALPRSLHLAPAHPVYRALDQHLTNKRSINSNAAKPRHRAKNESAAAWNTTVSHGRCKIKTHRRCPVS
jgi:hypothetical protein